MHRPQIVSQPGVAAALGAALLFGAGTPLAKQLLSNVDPWMLAGLLYLGSGLGLTAWRVLRRAPAVQLPPRQWRWLAGAVLAGGVVGPVLLMFGLSRMPASGASLLLNAEGVFTALLAWFAFKENFDRRIALGMAAIVAGAVVLSWPGEARFGGAWPALAGGLVLGLAAYGVSLALFVIGLRHLGTARTGAYFSVAPFFGAALAVLGMGEAVTPGLLLAAALMALGVWLHLTEQHRHAHAHEPIEHSHEHSHEHGHDVHHGHEHAAGDPAESHTHTHRHEALRHTHTHYPDEHHRHSH